MLPRFQLRRHKHSSREQTIDQKPQTQLRKALIVTKLSRYEVEQWKHPRLSHSQLAKTLRDRGTDYDLLIHYHRIHKQFTEKVAASFKDHGIEVQVANR